MEACVSAFAERLQQPWLTCESTQARLSAAFRHLVEVLEALPPQTLFVIAAEEPEATLAAVLAALATSHTAVLGNPGWTLPEAETAREMLGGTQLWLTAETDSEKAVTTLGRSLPPEHGLFLRPVTSVQPAPVPAEHLSGYLLVPTGGTGGRLKLACHNWQTLGAAIDGYAHFWNTETLNAVCALPVCHIGGLMPALRTFATNGRLCLLPWKKLLALSENVLPDLNTLAADWQISLVPTQVQRLLDLPAAVQWLRSMQAVLIGGGASDAGLLGNAAHAGIPLCPAYGMTETAATIALQRPEVFLLEYGRNDDRQSQNDAPQAGKPPLPASPAPTAQASPSAPATTVQAPTGEVLPHLLAKTEPQSGRIILSGESLFHGYFPESPRRQEHYATGDYGLLQDARPQLLRVLGRLDRIVVSGGKKVDPAIVEHCIRTQAHKLGIGLRAVLVTSVADPRWGQRLVAFIEQPDGCASLAHTAEHTGPRNEETVTERGEITSPSVPEALCEQVRKELPPHQLPKQWFCVQTLPLNERGKPDRHQIDQLANA